LVELPTDVSIADAVRAVKANFSRWLNRRGLLDGEFRWQAGFAAFTVSYSARDAVERYIARQGQRHARGGFAEELAELLKRHDVEYDERFLSQ
jgi:putative transposase